MPQISQTRADFFTDDHSRVKVNRAVFYTSSNSVSIFAQMNKGKYFLAIVVPEPFQNELMQLKMHVKEHYKSKAALRSPAHITLHMPFEWREDKESMLLEKLEAFSFNTSIPIQLKDFSHFESRVIFTDVVPNTTLEDLQKKLVRYMMENFNILNEATNMRGFHPHVTIAFRDLKKEQFRLAWDYFKEQHFSCDFICHSFCLLKHSPGKWEIFKEFEFLKPGTI